MFGNILPRWQFRYQADGVALTPPEGPSRGGIRIRELQPHRRARDIIDWAHDQMAGLGELHVSPLDRFSTYEGEFAALCTIVAAQEGRRYERTIGMVWGDHFYTQVDGGTEHVDSFPVFRQGVRDLVYYHALGLGELRRRRFVYAPPPDWRSYSRGLIAEWFAPGFPKAPGFISVFPARTTANAPVDELHRVLHEMSWFGFEREITDEPIDVVTHDGMPGHMWRVVGRFRAGPRLLVEVCALSDERFKYLLRLESRMGQEQGHHELFEQVIQSVTQLPRPVVAGDSDAFSHWMT